MQEMENLRQLVARTQNLPFIVQLYETRDLPDEALKQLIGLKDGEAV